MSTNMGQSWKHVRTFDITSKKRCFKSSYKNEKAANKNSSFPTFNLTSSWNTAVIVLKKFLEKNPPSNPTKSKWNHSQIQQPLWCLTFLQHCKEINIIRHLSNIIRVWYYSAFNWHCNRLISHDRTHNTFHNKNQ